MSETSPAPTDASTPPAPAPAAPVAVAVTPATPTPAAPTADDLAALAPDALAKMVRDLRAENAASRTTAKTQAADAARLEVTQQIAKALGLAPDDTPPDATQLTAEVAAARDTARQAQVELAVYRAATTANADAAALLDSRTFLAKVTDLDPTAGDFQTKVTAAITAAVTDNPKLRAAPVAGSSSVDHAGGSGERGAKPTTLEDAITRKLAG